MVKMKYFWLREGLKCFYLSCEGNTGILLLVMIRDNFLANFKLLASICHFLVFFHEQLTNKGRLFVYFLILICQSTCHVKFTIAKEFIYARVRIKTFDWVRRRRVIRKQIKRPTPLSFSFATAVDMFWFWPGHKWTYEVSIIAAPRWI